MELQKTHVFGVPVFGNPYCSSKNSTEVNAEHEST